MALSLLCACGAHFEVEDTLAGQDVACPECQQTHKAPTLNGSGRRTSDLALASAVLALIGAFTFIGTIVAVVLGTIGLIRIRRNSDRLAGAGFAIFGIAAGTLFTALTLLAFSSNELFGLGGKLRKNMLGDRVDTSGELTFEDAGFRITRPSREWGLSNVDRLEDPFVSMLQGQQQQGRKLDVLFVHTLRPVYVDVRSESRMVGTVDDMLLEAVQDLSPPPPPPPDPFNPRRRPVDDGNPIRITKVVPAASSKRLEGGAANIEAREKEVTVYCAGQQWIMVVRVYYTGNRLFVVRGYGQHRHFKYGEADVRKLMDSFTILDGQ